MGDKGRRTEPTGRRAGQHAPVWANNRRAADPPNVGAEKCHSSYFFFRL
jgi:hypothetical protein